MNKDRKILGINPENNKQARVFYDMYGAMDSHETRHPKKVMRELSEKLGFTILESIPQTLFDGWDFWIEGNLLLLELPEKLFRDGVPWKPIGQA